MTGTLRPTNSNTCECGDPAPWLILSPVEGSTTRRWTRATCDNHLDMDIWREMVAHQTRTVSVRYIDDHPLTLHSGTRLAVIKDPTSETQ